MRSDSTAAAAGAGMLAGAVIGYYAAVPIVVEGAAANMRSVVIWTGTALVGGPVFGIAGRWWRREPSTKRAIAIGLLSGVFVAEGLTDVRYVPTVRTAGWVLFAVGLMIPIVLGRSSQGTPARTGGDGAGGPGHVRRLSGDQLVIREPVSARRPMRGTIRP